MTELEILKKIKGLLADSYNGNNIIEIIQVPRFDGYRPDLIIKADKKIIAAIEIKSSEKLNSSLMSFTTDFYFMFKIRYFIYTDGVNFHVFDRLKNPKKSIKIDSEKFVFKMTSLTLITIQEELKMKVKSIIFNKIENYSKKNSNLISLKDKFSNTFIQQLKLSSEYLFYFENGKTDVNSFEFQLFEKLLNNKSPETIYRYCAFNRGFQIVDDSKIAMLGLPGMNDTTEPNYIDNYLNDSNEVPWEMAAQSRAALNRRFIMSCTTLPDDLMQWRLYGDDAKGCSLKFNTKDVLQNSQQFYLGEVKYADKNGEHPELKILKEIRKEIKEKLFLDIKFISLYVWKHFFKPYEYAYEKEIRLLYIHKKEDREKKWIIAEPYGIVNPMVIFDMTKNEFPLKLTEIMLGPKKSEKELNKSQLKQMISEKSKTLEVSVSKLNVYR
jgi:hypothetical protein